MKVVIAGKEHTACVLVVTSLDGDGAPREFRLLRDDETVEVTEGMQLWTAFVPSGNLARPTRQ